MKKLSKKMKKQKKEEKKLGIEESNIKKGMMIFPKSHKYYDLSSGERFETKNLKKSDFLKNQIKWNEHDLFTKKEIALIWEHLEKNRTDVFELFPSHFIYEIEDDNYDKD